MAAQDPYLHSGLTPPQDVSLYPSSAVGGGTNYTVTAAVTVVGTAGVARTATLARSAAATVNGAPSATRAITAARTAATTALATAATTAVVVVPPPLTPPPPPGGGGSALPYIYPRRARRFEVVAHAEVHATAAIQARPVLMPRSYSRSATAVARSAVRVSSSVDYSGRRRRDEDELVLVGML